MDESPTCEVKLPGFRFHPTEEELLSFYLKTMAFGKKLRADIIGFLNIYNHDPRELPGLAKKTIVETEREWYFFVPRDRKHGSGGRPNRTTEKGFWKATGSDRKILSVSDPKKILGLKKTLVFYEGRAPRGRRTDWIMNEYRLPDSCSPPKELVLCKIYRKATSLKVLEQRAAMETSLINTPIVLSPPMEDSISFEEANVTTSCTTTERNAMAVFKKENQEMSLVDEDRIKYAEQNSTSTTTTTTANSTSSSSLVLPNGMMGNLGELQVPQLNMDWTQDAFWTQFRSPWLDNFASFLPMC